MFRRLRDAKRVGKKYRKRWERNTGKNSTEIEDKWEIMQENVKEMGKWK